MKVGGYVVGAGDVREVVRLCKMVGEEFGGAMTGVETIVDKSSKRADAVGAANITVLAIVSFGMSLIVHARGSRSR